MRRALSDWLDWMGLIDAGVNARLDRMLGYYEPYATSHEALDRDTGLQEEVRNVARAVVKRSREMRAGRLSKPGADAREAAAQVSPRSRRAPRRPSSRRRPRVTACVAHSPCLSYQSNKSICIIASQTPPYSVSLIHYRGVLQK